MKFAKYLPLLITAVLFSYSYANLPQETQKNLSLISKPDPILADIEPLCVVVLSHNTEPNRVVPLLKNIKRKAEADLKKAGIEVFIVPDENNPPELPELRIVVDLLRPETANRYFLHIQTSLAKLVYLKKDGTLSAKTDIWKIGPAMEVSSRENLQAMAMRIASKQVDVFIHACIAANPAGKSSDANSETITQKPLAKSESETSKFLYVASKNGKAFHKETCFAASRIKPENLVTYNRREEALSAGKSPCKQCQP